MATGRASGDIGLGHVVASEFFESRLRQRVADFAGDANAFAEWVAEQF